ncbi:cobalamin binding intrinsic factor-like [Aquarana catesbeiana]|uniref:cobalamin binding intrinsic factor-like n=1 Tax=Aquarana catesbeiana TaxID=8400 RepID=UPI003CCA3A58
MLAYLLCVVCLLCLQDTGAQEDVGLIKVEFTVVNDLTENFFKDSIIVQVREGSTLLQVMEKAAELNPKEFSFQTEDYPFGVYITAIGKLAGSTNEKTYWQFFSGNNPLIAGVSDYKPSNNEHIIAVFSKF